MFFEFKSHSLFSTKKLFSLLAERKIITLFDLNVTILHFNFYYGCYRKPTQREFFFAGCTAVVNNFSNQSENFVLNQKRDKIFSTIELVITPILTKSTTKSFYKKYLFC